LDACLHGGFDAPLAPQRRARAQTLSPTRRKILRHVLLRKTPADYGIDSRQRIAPCARQWLGQKRQASLGNARLHEIFGESGLSRQKARRDYGPGRPGERADYAAALKNLSEAGPDAAAVAFDEFALLSTTYCHCAWAEKNAAPKLPSDEKKRRRLDGFLAVDLGSGQTTADFQPQAKAANVAPALAMVVLRHAAPGFRRIVPVLDDCRIRGEAMKAGLAEPLAEIVLARGVALDFLRTPIYSPDFNPAKCLIRLARKNSLCHLPCGLDVRARAERIRGRLAQGPPQTPEQMANILRHIYRAS
jgi:hypothetical protein